MKKLFLICFLILFLVTGCGKKEENLLGINFNIEGNESSEFNHGSENPEVAMYIENYGAIVIELYPDVAPNTINNFIYLTKTGFYDNNTFHRLEPGFVLQGGDPTGTGSGGPDYSIKGEFSRNGFDNDLSHTKWVVSMARSNSMDSAGSQFFIMLDDNTSLDGLYAAFGKVVDGFDVIDDIVENEKISSQGMGKLVNNLKIKKALVNLKGKEYPEPEKIEE